MCIYTGKILRTMDAICLEDKSYLMRLGPQVYVDPCEDKTVLGRYINDPRNRLLQNVMCLINVLMNNVLMLLLKEI